MSGVAVWWLTRDTVDELSISERDHAGLVFALRRTEVPRVPRRVVRLEGVDALGAVSDGDRLDRVPVHRNASASARCLYNARGEAVSAPVCALVEYVARLGTKVVGFGDDAVLGLVRGVGPLDVAEVLGLREPGDLRVGVVLGGPSGLDIVGNVELGGGHYNRSRILVGAAVLWEL